MDMLYHRQSRAGGAALVTFLGAANSTKNVHRVKTFAEADVKSVKLPSRIARAMAANCLRGNSWSVKAEGGSVSSV